MADNTLFSVPYKRSVSTNDKADVISKNLHDFKIAIFVMQRHPDVLNEFISAVKGPCKDPAPVEPTAPVVLKRHEYTGTPDI